MSEMRQSRTMSAWGQISVNANASAFTSDWMVLCCSKCEIKLEGEEPWAFPGAADDLQIIHTPGHTYGHIVLLHKPSKCGLALSPLPDLLSNILPGCRHS